MPGASLKGLQKPIGSRDFVMRSSHEDEERRANDKKVAEELRDAGERLARVRDGRPCRGIVNAPRATNEGTNLVSNWV